MSDFVGSEFIWGLGVVEDRKDPLKLGRCRVRVFALHSADKGLLPTEDLPWAHTLQSVSYASTSGVGHSPHGLVEGSWVYVFFQDGRNLQQPVILGSAHGIPSETASKHLGFNDPNGVYPKEAGEPDTNKLARGDTDKEHVIWSKKKETASGDNIDEPESPYAAEYPFNKVGESESGHIEEVDDTPGKERLHRAHRTGTFEEIHPDGTRVVKVVGDGYNIVLKDQNDLVKGNANLTVEGNVNIIVKGNVDMKVEGDMDANVDGDLGVTAKGNVDMKAGGNMNVESDGPMVFRAPTIDLN